MLPKSERRGDGDLPLLGAMIVPDGFSPLYAATLTLICLGWASGFFFNSSFSTPAL
jgi:hypothetical protein